MTTKVPIPAKMPAPTTPIARVKNATVAIVGMKKSLDLPSQQQPFQIIGSGFCVHPSGVIVTCKHVAEAFMGKPIVEQVETADQDGKIRISARQPFAVFLWAEPGSTSLVADGVGVVHVLAKIDDPIDAAVLRLADSPAFPDGYPFLELEDQANITEGLEIAVCGFPKGNALLHELGTVSSSFSRGIISSTVPYAGAPADRIRGYQLDLRATHGNSGGPVFSWQSGKLIGIPQGGIVDDYGHHLFSYAESVHKALSEDFVNKVLAL